MAALLRQQTSTTVATSGSDVGVDQGGTTANGVNVDEGGSGVAGRRAGGAAGATQAGGVGARGGAASSLSPAGGAGGTITIGLHYSTDVQAAYTALGASDAEPDVRPALEQLVAWINANGGMGGRRVLPVYHATNPLDGEFDAQAQIACSDYTEDHRVDAVVSGAILPSTVLADCLASRHVPLMWDYQLMVDQPMWDRLLPYVYQPFSMRAERIGEPYVGELAGAGYFNGATIGIVRYDTPTHARFTANVLRPQLAARGIKVAEEVAIHRPPSAAAAGDTVTQIGGAILRLRQAGVNHVMFVPNCGAVPFLFMAQAESQGFLPRYAMTTLDIPYFVNDQAPAGQLHGALVVGWSPTNDVYKEQEPGGSANRDLCYRIAKYRTPIRYCDGLFLLKFVLDRGASPDAAGLRRAIEGLGSAYDSPWTFVSQFGPGRHDSAGATRLAAFDDGCACFKYTGPLRPVP